MFLAIASPAWNGGKKMSRIRTVKPELFIHEGLFELEEETGLPVRLAFIGLFTLCDREGRFKWRPRELKLGVLPHDPIDFSRVIDALASRGFVVKYVAEDGQSYGYIPTWKKHQVINNRERQSVLPSHDLAGQTALPLTGEPRVDDAPSPCTLQGTIGREGKGTGREGNGTGTAHEAQSGEKSSDELFDIFWGSFNNKRGKIEAQNAWKDAIKQAFPESIIKRAGEYHSFCENTGEKQRHPAKWLEGQCWNDDINNTGMKDTKHVNFAEQDYTAGTEGFNVSGLPAA